MHFEDTLTLTLIYTVLNVVTLHPGPPPEVAGLGLVIWSQSSHCISGALRFGWTTTKTMRKKKKSCCCMGSCFDIEEEVDFTWSSKRTERLHQLVNAFKTHIYTCTECGHSASLTTSRKVLADLISAPFDWFRSRALWTGSNMVTSLWTGAGQVQQSTQWACGYVSPDLSLTSTNCCHCFVGQHVTQHCKHHLRFTRHSTCLLWLYGDNWCPIQLLGYLISVRFITVYSVLYVPLKISWASQCLWSLVSPLHMVSKMHLKFPEFIESVDSSWPCRAYNGVECGHSASLTTSRSGLADLLPAHFDWSRSRALWTCSNIVTDQRWSAAHSLRNAALMNAPHTLYS